MEWAIEQIVGRERRERLLQLAWCGAGCFDSRRRVNSTVRRFPIYSPATSSKGANMKKLFHLCAMLLALVPPALLTAVSSQVGVAQNADLRARIQQAPKLPLQAVALKALPLHDGWQLGMVSWIAVDRTGLIYLLQ